MEKTPTPHKLEVFLRERGYLTVNQFVNYLQECYPDKAVSYPTMQRYVFEKKFFKATKVGGQYRLEKPEILWYIEHGTEGIEGARMPSHSHIGFGHEHDDIHPRRSDAPPDPEPEPEQEELHIPIIK